MTTTQHTERLTRAEADIVVRQLAGRYYDRHGVDNTGRLNYFSAQLAWQIGGEDSEQFRTFLVDALIAFEGLTDVHNNDQPHDRLDRYESELNTAVNHALNAAGAADGWINRDGEQSETGLQPTPYGGMEDRAGFAALAKRVAA